MKRIAKYLGIAAAMLALLLTAGGWFVNRWLQSAAGHASVERKITEALHLPLKIESLGFSAWSGLSAKKISVTGPDGILFEAAGISASHSFSSLLHGSLALSEVRIAQPHFRLVQNAADHWALPRSAPAPQLPAPQPPAAVPAPQQPTVSAAAPQPAPAKRTSISIGKIIVEGGTAELFDKAHAPFATIKGLNVTLRDVTESAFSGNVAIEHAVLHGWIALDHFNALTTRDGQTFEFRNLVAEAGGGGVTGEGSWILGATGSATLKLNQVNLARATQEGEMTGEKIAGLFSGDVQFAGLGPDKKSITGKGALALKGGDCSQFELLRQIGDVLRVSLLSNFQIADATAKFEVVNEQVILSPMDISTPPVGLSLNGPVAFDGTLNLSASLNAPASLVASQPLIAGQFSPPDAGQRQSVPFTITGTLKKPRQNLAEALTGTKDRKQQRIIAGEAILSTIFENTNIGKKNPKLMKLLPEIFSVKPAPPPQPVPAQQ